MRLVVDTSIRRHPYGGTARYATELVRSLRGSIRHGDSIVEATGWPRLRRGRRIGRYVNAAADLLWLGAGGPALALARRADVWYSPANILPPAMPVPAVVTMHDVNFLIRPEDYDPAFARYAGRMFSLTARRATIVITDSEFSRRCLVEAFAIEPGRIVVAYPGLDHILRASSSTPFAPLFRKPYALYVGQTERNKNIGILLDAWASRRSPAADLVIAGPPGRAHEAILARVARAPLAGRVHVLGRVSEEKLGGLYSQAACFIFPSFTEGFGFPPLEAMARGVPTAVADAASLPEVTRGAALLFDPADAEAVVAVVERLLDPATRALQAEKGRSVTEAYRWSDTAGIVWSVLRRAAEG